MAVRMCPDAYVSRFRADWKAGVPMNVLQRNFPRDDGHVYSERTIRYWASVLELPTRRGHAPTPTPSGDRAEQIQQELERQDAAQLKIKERQALQHDTAQERLYRLFADQIPALPAQMPLVAPRKASAAPSEEIVALVSDIQLGALIDRPSTAGIGAYNFAIYQERLDTYRTTFKRLVQMHQQNANVERIVMAFDGDLVEGDTIFAGQGYQIEMGAVEQTMAFARTWGPVLIDFASLGIPIHVIRTPGNHGRQGRKGETPIGNNLDVMAVDILELYLSQQAGIYFHPSPHWAVNLSIAGHELIVEHGDLIKAGARLAVKGVLDRFTCWRTDMKHPNTHALMVGHFHDLTYKATGNGGHVLINGCWPGPSQFSVQQLGLGGVPSQWLTGWNRSHGLIWQSPIYLDEAPPVATLPLLDLAVPA